MNVLTVRAEMEELVTITLIITHVHVLQNTRQPHAYIVSKEIFFQYC